MFSENMEANGYKKEKPKKLEDKELLKEWDKINNRNVSKLDHRHRFLSNDEPNKIEIQEATKTLKDKHQIAKDYVQWEWMQAQPWFTKEVWNKTISVESYPDSFYLSVEWDTWKEIGIKLEKKTEYQKNGKWETKVNMHVTWGTDNYEYMKWFWPEFTSIFPYGLKSSDNPQEVKKAILWLEKLVMNPEIHAVHGQKDKQQKEAIKAEEAQEKRVDDLSVLLAELQFDPKKSNNEIEYYLMDMKNFENNGQNWYINYRKLLVSLIILHRHSSFVEIQNHMKNKNIEDLQENTQRNADEKNIDDWELIVEYLSNNPIMEELAIDYSDHLIKLALNSDISNDEKLFLQL